MDTAPYTDGYFHNMEVNMTIDEWKKKSSGIKKYAHFDPRVSVEQVWDKISSPDWVEKHGFYPFISYEQVYYRYSKEKGRYKKIRPICYSAHIDRCIYQYYGYLINEKYNSRVEKEGIGSVAIAYRNNLNKNNIDFSKQAFDFIRSYPEAYIIVGDFTDFFNNLDHAYLKDRLCDLMECSKLPGDYYAVLKNITKYSYWELKDILELNGLPDTIEGRTQLNNNDTALTMECFRQNKKKHLKRNTDLGIPQGSAISAVLSNVYMLQADILMNQMVKSIGGLYMRYSDDFIVIIPSGDAAFFLDMYNKIMHIINEIPKLELKQEKTQVYLYAENNVTNCNKLINPELEQGKNILNYLGFSFDGKRVFIRDKTISKYYYRMYRKARSIRKANGVTKYGNIISNKKIYEKYSIKGSKQDDRNRHQKGNFITYVIRASSVYMDDDAVGKVMSNHMVKIKRATRRNSLK